MLLFTKNIFKELFMVKGVWKTCSICYVLFRPLIGSSLLVSYNKEYILIYLMDFMWPKILSLLVEVADKEKLQGVYVCVDEKLLEVMNAGFPSHLPLCSSPLKARKKNLWLLIICFPMSNKPNIEPWASS